MLGTRSRWGWLAVVALMAACQQVVDVPPLSFTPAPTGATPPLSSGIRVSVPWTYTDEQRLGLEVHIAGYPLPPGASDLSPLFFPISRVTLIAGQQRIPLYRNLHEDGLEAYWSVYPGTRFYLRWEHRSERQTDFHLSFVHFWTQTRPRPLEPWTLELVLGEFRIPIRPGHVLVLPAQGVFTVPVRFPSTSAETRTLGPASPLQAQGLTARLDRVLINPTVTWFDVCLRHPARAFWEPVGEIRVGPQVWPATQWHSLAPPPLAPLQELLHARQRCFTFVVPISDTHLLHQPFEVGLREVRLRYDDGHVLTWEMCEDARRQVEDALPGARLRCLRMTLRGEPQIWFDIQAWPEGSSRQQVYDRMVAALVQRLDAGWFWRLEP